MYLGPDGIVAAARPGTLIVEHGTFDPALAHEIADAAADRGVLFVDAPVSGGAVAAEAGALAIMAGGPAEAEARFREVVAPYARVIEWLGPVGSGLALKLVNQMLVKHARRCGDRGRKCGAEPRHRSRGGEPGLGGRLGAQHHAGAHTTDRVRGRLRVTIRRHDRRTG